MDKQSDNWEHRSDNIKCQTCMWFVPKKDRNKLGYDLGRCRRHAPTISGYPVVMVNDFCGDHKLDENEVRRPISEAKDVWRQVDVSGGDDPPSDAYKQFGEEMDREVFGRFHKFRNLCPSCGECHPATWCFICPAPINQAFKCGQCGFMWVNQND